MSLPVTTMAPNEPRFPWGGGPHTITCECGENVTYEGYWFTKVEMERHIKWHERQSGEFRSQSR